jgi:DNA processing protein
MNLPELHALIQLQCLPGIGSVRLRRLMQHYDSFQMALQAPSSELGEAAVAERGSRRTRERAVRAAAELERLGAAVITEIDDRYPEQLRQLDQPPYVIYGVGRLELMQTPCVAIIGARRHTEYGREVARLFASAMAGAGLTVVSGLARGIDGLAHTAALEAGGGTIAVQGCGSDVVYPREHVALQRRIAEEGLLLTEFPPGEPPLANHFPRRNRLIAALAMGVVVVEAGERSGSLITVGQALELGREVFAVPGPITRPPSAGTNALIRAGATLVRGPFDVLDGLAAAVPDLFGPASGVSVEKLQGEVQPKPARQGTDPTEGAGATDRLPASVAPEKSQLWRELDREPRHIEELAQACGLRLPEALAGLLELEVAGLARQLPGKQFLRA